MVFTVLRKQCFSSMAAGGMDIFVILLKEKKMNEKRKRPMTELLEETKANRQYLTRTRSRILMTL